jgi:aconitate hydratase
MFDLELIKKVYAELPEKVEKAKKKLNRPMTYAEKILYAHLFDSEAIEIFERGKPMSIFRPTG